MNIQANINQGISLMSLLYSQTPMAEEARESMAHTRQIKGAEGKIKEAEKAENIALEEYQKILDNPKITDEGILQSAEYKGYTAAGEAVEDAYKDLMRLDPSTGTYKRIVARQRESAEQREAVEQVRKKSPIDKQNETSIAANEALAAEQQRLANTPDFSHIDERARPRLERAYNRALRDTKYLTKKEGTK